LSSNYNVNTGENQTPAFEEKSALVAQKGHPRQISTTMVMGYFTSTNIAISPYPNTKFTIEVDGQLTKL